MNHIEQQRQLFAKNRDIIQQLIGWDDLTYTTFQYESGLIYLEETMLLHEYEQKMLSSDEMFWKWWVNQWNIVDSIMLPVCQRRCHPLSLKEYINRHSLAMTSVYPDHELIEESYAKMIGEFNDKHNSHATR